MNPAAPVARHNATGRSKATSGHFVMVPHAMMETAAWRALSPQERAVYLEAARLYNGRNNGFLGLGARAAAKRANINKDTAARCLKRLEELGFLEPTQLGKFNMNSRRATEWRLTLFRCDRTQRPASKAFASWLPEDLKHRPKRGPEKSETEGQRMALTAIPVPRLRTIAGGLAGG